MPRLGQYKNEERDLEIYKKWLGGMTQKGLACLYGKSINRINQIIRSNDRRQKFKCWKFSYKDYSKDICIDLGDTRGVEDTLTAKEFFNVD